MKIAAGERILPEYVRVVLAGCMKVAALNASVYTMPSKEKGLRIQTSDIILGKPGVGKGQAFQWRDDLVVPIKEMLQKYAEDELKISLQPVQGPMLENQNIPRVEPRPKFKYIGGVERLADLPLPFLLDLPNGSSEAVFLIASRNAGAGMVPILE